MGRRNAVPLHRTRHVDFVEAAASHPNPDIQVAGLLHVGTGPRADTIGHVHADWFQYKRPRLADADKFTEEYPPLYLKVPDRQKCRKYGDNSPCGDCRRNGHVKDKNGEEIGEYEPKTPAAGGREILLDDEWYNPVTEEREYFPLRDVVESYFALSGTRAPDGLHYGEQMITGNGVSVSQLNNWYRDIGAQATISAQEREDWLRTQIDIEDPDNPDTDRQRPQIKDFGTDSDGNEIPDIITHDMRATYCTQLMRPMTAATRTEAIQLTGHASPESMEPYVSFANDEISSGEETLYY